MQSGVTEVPYKSSPTKSPLGVGGKGTHEKGPYLGGLLCGPQKGESTGKCERKEGGTFPFRKEGRLGGEGTT